MKKINRLLWLRDFFENEVSFVHKKMFGCEAFYLRGKLVLVLADNKEPWNGLLVCTSRDFHANLMAKFPSLKKHKVLGKWLYLTQKNENFEELATKICDLILKGTECIGVESKPKNKAKKTAKSVTKKKIRSKRAK